MSHSDMQRAWAAAGLAAALIATTMSTSIGFAASGVDQQRARTPTPTPAVNLLRNGGFEGEYVRQWNAANTEWANGRVAEGWLAWWRKPTAPDGKYPGRCPDGDSVCQAWHRPEYRQTKGIPYTPPRIRGGDNSQMYFTSFGVHEGGLYQKAGGAPKGWRVRFSIWARVWSSDTEDTRSRAASRRCACASASTRPAASIRGARTLSGAKSPIPLTNSASSAWRQSAGPTR